MTVRQRLEVHTDANCAGCHSKIDPLGFAWDNYDAIGQWRDHEGVPTGVGANPIVDASGKMPDGRSFATPAEFKELLLDDRDKVARAFIEHLCTYALRRVLTVDDEEDIQQIVTEAKKSGYQLEDIIRHVALSDLLQNVNLLNKNQASKTMNYLSRSWQIDRRHALRAMGSCIALPMLECMNSLNATEAESNPRRSAFIYLANGVHSLNYQITQSGSDYEFSRSLKPLEKYRDSITPISGLHHPGGLGHHHNCTTSADRRKDRPVPPQHDFGGPTDGQADRTTHPLSLHGSCHHLPLCMDGRWRQPRDAPV